MQQSTFELKHLLSLFHRNSDVLANAYYNNGVIEETIENEKLIEALIQMKMAWRIDQYENVKLKSVVKQFFDMGTSNSRRRAANAPIAENYEHIKKLINDIKHLSKQGRFDEVIKFRSEVQERVGELIEDLRSSNSDFSNFVTKGHGFTKDLKLRIEENERVLEMARKLSVIIDELLRDAPYDLHGGIKELSLTFEKHLYDALRKARTSLNASIHNLRTLLNKIRKDYEAFRLVATFDQLFIENPGVDLHIDDLTVLPECVNIAEPIMLSAYGDVYSEAQEDVLVDILSAIKIERKKTNNINLPSVAIEPDEVDDFISEPNYLLESADALVNAAVNGEVDTSALQAYLDLGIESLDVSSEIWVLAIMNQISSLTEADYGKLCFNLVQEQDEEYNGRFELIDIEIGRVS